MDTESEERTVPILEDAQPAIDKLFVYGIFLDEINRQYYGMENASYDTVKNYITIGDVIATAIPTTLMGVVLTGLLVDVPTRKLPSLDILETNYDRVKVTTTGGFEAFMYVGHQDKLENYSNIKKDFYEQEQEQTSF